GAHPYHGPEAGSIEDAVEISIEPEEIPTWPTGRALPETPLFSGLDEDTLRDLIEKLDYQTFLPDQVIARQGEVGDSLYVIAVGEVSVVHEGPPLRELTR